MLLVLGSAIRPSVLARIIQSQQFGKKWPNIHNIEDLDFSCPFLDKELSEGEVGGDIEKQKCTKKQYSKKQKIPLYIDLYDLVALILEHTTPNTISSIYKD